jgi:hypothetical protein
MKENVKLFYSLDKVDPAKLYRLKLAIKKAGLPAEFLQWHNSENEEQKTIAYLLLTYRNQLLLQQTTIETLGTPALTWTNLDGTLDIRVGYESILGEL